MQELNARLFFTVVLMTKNSERFKLAVTQLSNAFTGISKPVFLVGFAANRTVEMAILKRYVQLCYFTALAFRLHQIPLPDEHLVK